MNPVFIFQLAQYKFTTIPVTYITEENLTLPSNGFGSLDSY